MRIINSDLVPVLSFDFDGTLTVERVNWFMLYLKSKGFIIKITTSRDSKGDNSDIIKFCKDNKISYKNVIYTKGELKAEHLSFDIYIDMHFDNDKAEIRCFERIFSHVIPIWTRDAMFEELALSSLELSYDDMVEFYLKNDWIIPF